jgi:hypothetical protein
VGLADVLQDPLDRESLLELAQHGHFNAEVFEIAVLEGAHRRRGQVRRPKVEWAVDFAGNRAQGYLDI